MQEGVPYPRSQSIPKYLPCIALLAETLPTDPKRSQVPEESLVGLILVALWLIELVHVEKAGGACRADQLTYRSRWNRESGERTRIALPVKVLLRVAVTFVLYPLLVAGGTMGERHMVVGNVIEEVDLLFLQGQSCTDGMYRGVTPSFVEETAILVEEVEVVHVRG